MSTTTWFTLMTEAKLPKGSVALALAEKHADDSSGAVKTLADTAARILSGPDYRTVLRKYANALLPIYFLVVKGGKVEVLYGLKTCHETATANGRVLFLIGDRRRNLPPALYRTTGAAANQHQAFDTIQGMPRTGEGLEEWFQDPANVGNLAPALPDGDGALIAAQWAALFMPGVPIWHAMQLGIHLVGLLPPEEVAAGESLLQWLRMAATAQADGQSLIPQPWTRMDVDEDEVHGRKLFDSGLSCSKMTLEMLDNGDKPVCSSTLCTEQF
jgi:hypothetical protein